MGISRSALSTLGICLLMAAAASACSSSGGSSSAASSGGGASSAASSSAAPAASSGGSSAPAATGGTAAPVGASPVQVGFHNLEGGSISLPDVRQGFQAGVDYVNSQLDGINGHPLKAVVCDTDGTPEASLNCANEFVQKKVVLAVQGADFGADAMLPVLKSAHLAELGGFVLTPGMNAATGNAYFMAASTQEGYAADIVQQHNLGAKSVAVVMVDNPSDHQVYSSIIAPAAAKLGMTARAFYSPTQANWTTLAAVIGATHPDAISLFEAGNDALSAVSALRAAGFTGNITDGANTEIVQQLSASQLKNVYFNSATYLPNFTALPAAVKGDMTAFNTYEQKDTHGVGSISQAIQGFYVAVMAAEALQQIPGSPTAQSVYAGMTKVKGPREIFRTNGFDCATPTWPGTTACGGGMIYVTANAAKQLVPLPNQPVDVSSVR